MCSSVRRPGMPRCRSSCVYMRDVTSLGPSQSSSQRLKTQKRTGRKMEAPAREERSAALEGITLTAFPPLYMRKIRINMAEMAADTAKEIPVNGAKKKKKWYNKVIKTITPTAWRRSSDNPEEKEITAEDIQKLIEEKQYQNASQMLINLEHNIFSKLEEPTSEEKKELGSLYDKLKAAVFQAIKQSLTSTDETSLQQAVLAIVVQEYEDSQLNPDLDNSNRSRPGRWMQAWKECVKQNVEERLKNLPQKEKPKESSSFISAITGLAVVCKTDLIHVVKDLKKCYPEQFDVCNTYAQHYHQNMKRQIEQITQFEMLDKDNYTLLCWVQNLYPNEILKSVHLNGHIDVQRLGSLLQQNKIRQLEKDYLIYEADAVATQMNKAFDLEEEVLKTGKEPNLLGPHYHSELHIDITQCYASGFQRASEIRPEIKDRLAPLLAHELKDFLGRYKNQFGEYVEKNRNQIFYRATCITHLNCCLFFRQFINGKESELRENERLDMLSLLLQLEDTIYNALLRDLFADLKAKFKKMSQGSSPFSYSTMQTIIRTSEDFMVPFNTLMDGSYKVLSGKIHLYLVKEHLSRILKRKVSNKTMQQMQTLANQIRENADLIDKFSVSYRSCEDWLKPALSKLAEIIRLQDLNAIQLEVATLVEVYPDIRNKQIEAILYMKGNLNRHEVKLILKTVDSLERKVKEKQKLFELIQSS